MTNISLIDAALAVTEAAGYGGGADWYARQLARSGGGLTLLANLCNAVAKEAAYQHGNPALAERLYRIKPVLIHGGVVNCQLCNLDVWREPHQDTRGDYPADTVIYIRLHHGTYAFHCRADDPAYAPILAGLPERRIGWDGIPKQPIARALIDQYLNIRKEEVSVQG